MNGYCEGCASDRPGDSDEYGVMVCVDCGCDLIVEVHVDVEETLEEGYEYPQYYDGSY